MRNYKTRRDQLPAVIPPPVFYPTPYERRLIHQRDLMVAQIESLLSRNAELNRLCEQYWYELSERREAEMISQKVSAIASGMVLL